MKYGILKKVLLFFVITLSLFSFSCEKAEYINVTVKVVDSETKKPEAYDTIDVRREENGFPMKKYVLVESLILDSIGEIKIRIEKDEIYKIITGSKNTFGSETFRADLNNKVINIETVPIK